MSVSVVGPGAELGGLVKKVFGEIECPQETALLCSRADADDEASQVGVLDDLDDRLVEVHTFAGWRADNGDAFRR
ncbi:hypothetical protein [Nocardioides antri]|uniref:Uncharacterized protein n=1 Tax=Nocardioides antri TaxID=2607659 RepID=A0A5B1M6S7_9ACTN|nr:hypothetical protein [Nocardioides antri]KAA1427789.1 hypothetical protein F0U47_10200 [Nocardioides antri]